MLSSFRSTPYNLQFVFAGKMYEWEYNSTFAPGVTNFQLKTPSLASGQLLHLINRVMLTASSALNFQFIKNSVISVQGTSSQSIFNVNRNLNSTSRTKIFTNPSATSGSAFENFNLISKDPFIQQTPEIILKSDTDYIMRINNAGGVNAVINFSFLWYESNN